MPSLSTWLRTALRLALAALVLGVLAVLVDAASLARLARGADPALLAASVAAFFVDQLLAVVKWRGLLAGIGVEVGLYRLFKTATKGFFVSFFLPSALTADLYKGIELARAQGGGSAVTSSIVLERLLGFASIVTVSAMALGALPTLRGGGAGLAAAALALGLGLAAFLNADRVLAALLPALPARVARLDTVARELAAAFALYRGRRRVLVEAFLLSVAIQLARSAATWLVARAVGDATPFAAFVFLVPYIYLVNLLPFATSRIGLEQGAFVVLFAAAGMAPDVALTVSLLAVATGLVVALPGGVWLVTEWRGHAARGGEGGA
jgi:hypothetical protein